MLWLAWLCLGVGLGYLFGAMNRPAPEEIAEELAGWIEIPTEGKIAEAVVWEIERRNRDSILGEYS